jgi:pimeloyl-ACP methyl ester carboxylesterase
MATNWSGICDNVSKISNPTLVITGTDDVVVPSANSLVIAAKVPGIWLVQIKHAGHALMSQYPYKFNKVLQMFLSITTKILLDKKIVIIYHHRTYVIRLGSFF